MNANINTKKRSIVGIMAALLAACFAFQLNASMLSPALVIMEKELNTDAATIGLTQTVFFTAAALFSLFLPRLGDMIGRRKLLTSMLALTAIGCLISAFAGVTGSVALLFVGRIIQGVAGPTVPLCLIMLRVAVPDPKRYGTLMGIIAAVNGGIAGVDAIAGGWLAQNFGFEAVFWTMAAIAVIAVVFVHFLCDESTVPNPERMDWPGTITLVIAVGSLLTAVNEIAKLADANWILVIVLALVSAAFFVAFWNRENNAAAPLVSTKYLRSRSTWALLMTTTLTMTGIFAIMNGIIPSIAQNAEFGANIGADVVSFWTLTPYALAGLAMGPIAGTLAGKYGYRLVLRIGLVGSLAAILVLALLMTNINGWILLGISLFAGIAYAGTVNIVLNGLGIVLSPEDNPGYLPGLNAGAFNLGAGMSFAILYAVMTSFGGAAGGHLAAIITGAILLGLALLSSFLIPKPGAKVAA